MERDENIVELVLTRQKTNGFTEKQRNAWIDKRGHSTWVVDYS